MPAVTHVRSTPSELADAGGAFRPALSSSGRPALAGTAAVILLRPPAGPPAAPDPAAVPGPDPGVAPGRPGVAPRRGAHESSPSDATSDLSLRMAGIARSVAQGALEVLGGSRPLQQMARWLDPENYERLQLRANLVRCISATPGAGRGDPPVSAHRHVVVRSARVCPVGPGVYEASVVAFDQKRVRAVALRIEQRRGAWRVTALEIG